MINREHVYPAKSRFNPTTTTNINYYKNLLPNVRTVVIVRLLPFSHSKWIEVNYLSWSRRKWPPGQIWVAIFCVSFIYSTVLFWSAQNGRFHRTLTNPSLPENPARIAVRLQTIFSWYQALLYCSRHPIEFPWVLGFHDFKILSFHQMAGKDLTFGIPSRLQSGSRRWTEWRNLRSASSSEEGNSANRRSRVFSSSSMLTSRIVIPMNSFSYTSFMSWTCGGSSSCIGRLCPAR